MHGFTYVVATARNCKQLVYHHTFLFKYKKADRLNVPRLRTPLAE